MWPESLCREIAERRCVIHAGSGLSCQSFGAAGDRPPSWPVLLRELSSKLSGSTGALADQLITDKKFLDAAEVVRSNIPSAEYSSVIKSRFLTPAYGPSKAHKSVVQIAPKIFLTTNYDTIIESTLTSASGIDSYTQFEYGTEGLNDAIRSPDTILIKMHGCAKHPGQTILSRSDYFKLRAQYGHFFNTIEAIYNINTVLFIGCGFEDPDILLLLENICISAPGTTHSNYALLGERSYGSVMKALLKSQYNIEVITYAQTDENDHSQFEPALDALENDVAVIRAKYGVS
jgi:hypothetical protein